MATQDSKSGSTNKSNLGASDREESYAGVNKAGMTTFILAMAVTFASFFYVSFFSGGIDLKEVKPAEAPVEQVVAAAPVDVSGITEPWLANEDMVKHGAAVYKTNCAMCHGAGGAGDGVAGANLNPKPRNLIEGQWKQGGGELALFKTLQTGIPGGSMQGYKDALSAKDRWALVQFVQSITKDPVKDAEADLKAKAPTLQ